MANLAPLDRGEVTELQDVFDAVNAQFGYVPNSMLTMARTPELVKALVGMLGAVFGPGAVSPEIKRLAAFGVSHAAGCQYCVAHMTHGAEHEGMAPEKIADLCEASPKTLSPAEDAVVRVARGAAANPNAVSEADFAALKEHFDDTQIVEIVATISMMGFFNRWNDTMATHLEDSPRGTACKLLPEGAWTVGQHA